MNSFHSISEIIETKEVIESVIVLRDLQSMVENSNVTPQVFHHNERYAKP